MSKIKQEFEKDKEYVFLSENGKFYVFRFTNVGRKKIALTRKEDVLSVLDIEYKWGVPLSGDFTWSYDFLFGRKGLKWECLGEL